MGNLKPQPSADVSYLFAFTSSQVQDQERLIVLGKELVSLKSQLLQLLLNCGVGEDS